MARKAKAQNIERIMTPKMVKAPSADQAFKRLAREQGNADVENAGAETPMTPEEMDKMMTKQKVSQTRNQKVKQKKGRPRKNNNDIASTKKFGGVDTTL